MNFHIMHPDTFYVLERFKNGTPPTMLVAYDSVPHYSAAVQTEVYVPAQGDLDADGDVDQSDFGFLQTCFSGNGVPLSAPPCQEADMDLDSDIDNTDYHSFFKCLTGPGVPADPQCAG